jgi:rod shape determining protein RodA
MPSTRQPAINIGEIDKATLWTVITLAFTGWLMIYAAEFKAEESWAFMDLQHSAGKQLFSMVLCAGLFFIIQLIEWTFWRTFAWAFYAASLVLQIGVFFVGKEVNGAKIWYQIGGFSLQPTELVKFATCLALANYLSGITTNIRQTRQKLLAFGVFLLPMLLIISEDMGSALVFTSFFLLMYREGLSANYYIIGAAAAALVILGLIFEPIWVATSLMVLLNGWFIFKIKGASSWWILWGSLIFITLFWGNIWGWICQISARDLWNEWSLEKAFFPLHALLLGLLFNLNYAKKNSTQQRPVLIGLVLLIVGIAVTFGANYFCFQVLKPHQQTRIKVWLRPQECDPHGALYNLVQSKMAIGSGGFGGKGFLDGNMTQLRYVPKQSTDFIFCTIGEEQGFIGSMAIIGLFTLLLWRITVLAERQRTDFARRYAYGVAGILFIHLLINIGMTMGLFPIIGIPLPFISYGGSSLIGFTLMMAVLLKLDSSQRERG